VLIPSSNAAAKLCCVAAQRSKVVSACANRATEHVDDNDVGDDGDLPPALMIS